MATVHESAYGTKRTSRDDLLFVTTHAPKTEFAKSLARPHCSERHIAHALPRGVYQATLVVEDLSK